MEKTTKRNVGIKLELTDIKELRAEAKRKRTSLSGLIRTLIFKDAKEEPQSN